MGTIAASSCSAADVQSAINSAADGDIVTVPAGEADYDDTHLVTCAKGITIQGAGIDATIIYDKTGGSYNKEPFVITTKNGYTTKITGFTFDGANSGASSMGMIKLTGTYGQGNFRVHHNKFRNILIRGATAHTVFGLFDHNTFLAPYDATAQALSIFGDGADAFQRALTLGSVNAVFVEDNTFTFTYMNDGCLDAYGGARYVFRYNTVTNTPIGHHGCDSGGYRSTHSWEIYENDFAASIAIGAQRVFMSRGGTGVVWNNRAVNTGSGNYAIMELMNYRSGVYPTFNDANYSPWGYCDGDAEYDGNESGKQGYHCQDQNGWTGSGSDDGTGPNQILAPIYAWGNTIDGSPVLLTVYDGADAGRMSLHMVENRDFYNATKSGYTPYTYPHPLQEVGEEAGFAGNLIMALR